jgi:hypothetical protein
MYLVFGDQYGSIIIEDELIDELAALESQELRLHAFRELLQEANSPYEFLGMIFNRLGGNLKYLIPNCQA